MAPIRGVERKAALACDACRQRKIRCDSSRPVCGSCRDSRVVCAYTPTTRPTKADWRYEELSQKLSNIEAILMNRLVKPSDSGNIKELIADNNAAPEMNPAEQEIVARSEAPLFNDVVKFVVRDLGLNNFGCSLTVLSYLSKSIQQSDTLQRLRSLSKHIMQKRTPVNYRLESNVGRQELDVKLVKWSIERHCERLQAANPDNPDIPDHEKVAQILPKRSTDMVLRFLMTSRDFESDAWEQMSPWLRTGFEVAAVIETFYAAQFAGNTIGIPFPEEFCEDQKAIAINIAIEFLESLEFLPSSFLLVRCGMVIIWLLNKFSFLPSASVFHATLLSKARSIGMDRKDVNEKFPLNMAVQRLFVWRMLLVFQQTSALFRLEEPIIVRPDSITTYFGAKSPADHSIGIHSIYNEAREKLFSVNNAKYSPKTLYNTILRLDTDISIWYSKLPGHYHQGPFDYRSPNTVDFVEWLKSHYIPVTRLKYLITLLIIHSIPAFYPNYLPASFPRPSLEIVTECAFKIIDIATKEVQIHRSLSNAACNVVTSAVITLFCRQVRYPQHQQENQQNLEILQVNMIYLIGHAVFLGTDTSKIQVFELWKGLMEIMSDLLLKPSIPQQPEKDLNAEAYSFFDGFAPSFLPNVGDENMLLSEYDTENNNCIIN